MVALRTFVSMMAILIRNAFAATWASIWRQAGCRSDNRVPEGLWPAPTTRFRQESLRMMAHWKFPASNSQVIALASPLMDARSVEDLVAIFAIPHYYFRADFLEADGTIVARLFNLCAKWWFRTVTHAPLEMSSKIRIPKSGFFERRTPLRLWVSVENRFMLSRGIPRSKFWSWFWDWVDPWFPKKSLPNDILPMNQSMLFLTNDLW